MPPASSTDAPLTAAPDGVRVGIRLTPRAGANRIEGIVRSTDGRSSLKVFVTAPPADDRANEALIALLAKEWRLPRRDISIAGGAKNRNKIIHIAGDPRALTAKIAAMLALLPQS